jgi:hypothetical protein
MALTLGEKEKLKQQQGPDSGLAGNRFSTFNNSYNLNPKPGLSSDIDLISVLYQDVVSRSLMNRLDDGFTGERSAIIIHVEEKLVEKSPDIETISMLIEQLTPEQREEWETSGGGKVTVFYCIPAGGTTVSNIVPDSLMRGDSTAKNPDIDYAKIINYPRFYSLLPPEMEEGSTLTAAVGKQCFVEFLDKDEFRFGVFKRMNSPTAQGDVVRGDGKGGPGKKNPRKAFKGPLDRADVEAYHGKNVSSEGYIGSAHWRNDPYPGHDTRIKDDYTPAGRKQWQSMRKDVKGFFDQAMVIPRKLGVPILTIGATMMYNSYGQHSLGKAIDFDTLSPIETRGSYGEFDKARGAYCGPMKVNYIVTPEPGRTAKFRLYMRVDEEVAKQNGIEKTRVLAWIQSSTRGGSFLEYVETYLIDVTSLLEKEGFMRISSHYKTNRRGAAWALGPDPISYFGGAESTGGKFKSAAQMRRDSGVNEGTGDARLRGEWWHYQYVADIRPSMGGTPKDWWSQNVALRGDAGAKSWFDHWVKKDGGVWMCLNRRRYQTRDYNEMKKMMYGRDWF